MNAILFYKTRGIYGCFSNFSRDPVTIFGRTWPTSEHAFQAMKFYPHAPALMQKVFEATMPGDAADMGRDRSKPISPNWDKPHNAPVGSVAATLFAHLIQDGRSEEGPVVVRYKDAIMYLVVFAKFTQDPELTKTLLSTAAFPLIEDTTKSGDSYWGWGSDHKGDNRLGKILMGVRGVLARNATNYLILTEMCKDMGLDSESVRKTLSSV